MPAPESKPPNKAPEPTPPSVTPHAAARAAPAAVVAYLLILITEAIVAAAKHRIPLTSVQRFARHKSFNTTSNYVNSAAADVAAVMNSLKT